MVYGSELGSYRFNEDHPLQPTRYELTISLLTALGWLDAPQVHIEPPRQASLAELLTAHTYPYVQAVIQAQNIARGSAPPSDLRLYGLGVEDNPLFPSIHDAAALCAGASLQAMAAVLEGRALHAYNPAGGLHHAMRARASGFCVYNDCAVAIAGALEAGSRVAYVDLDAHHGDGVQEAFYADPRVLTVSIHESGRFLFPGTGDVEETGTGRGTGTSINVPLPPLAGDEAILEATDRIVLPAVRAFAPDLLVTQTGCDTHHTDPLTHLSATLSLYPLLADRLHRLAHECCSGRWLILGGGGYDPADVTPRAWTSFLGTVLGHATDDVLLPEQWREASREAGGDPPPRLLDDLGPQRVLAETAGWTALLERIERSAIAPLVERSR